MAAGGEGKVARGGSTEVVASPHWIFVRVRGFWVLVCGGSSEGKGGAGGAPTEWRPEVVREGVGEGKRWCWGWERKERGGAKSPCGFDGEEKEAVAVLPELAGLEGDG